MHWTLLLLASPDASHLDAVLAGIRRQTRAPDQWLVWDETNPSAYPTQGMVWILDMNTVPLPHALETLDARAQSTSARLLAVNVFDKESKRSSLPEAWKMTQWLEPRNVREEWWSVRYPCGAPLSAWAGEASILLPALLAGHDLPVQANALANGMGLVTERIAVRTPLPSDWDNRMNREPMAVWSEIKAWSTLLEGKDRDAWLSAVQERLRKHQLGQFESEMAKARLRFGQCGTGFADKCLLAGMGLLRRTMSFRLGRKFHVSR